MRLTFGNAHASDTPPPKPWMQFPCSWIGAICRCSWGESQTMLGNFLKGPVGMGVIGALMTVGTAVTGVTAGPSIAHAVSDRMNATPAPTPVPVDTETPTPKPTPKPATATATALPPNGSGTPAAAAGKKGMPTATPKAAAPAQPAAPGAPAAAGQSQA